MTPVPSALPAAPGVPSAPPSPPVGPLLLAIGAVTCLEFLETGMVTFSAGPIMGGLGLKPESLALSFTVYGVAAIFMLYKHQWMVERWGYRRFTLASLALFALGAVICASADGLAAFLVGRALQGASGATFFTAGRLAVNQVPPERRFWGVLAFVSGLFTGCTLAPLMAAWLTESFGWRAVFWAVPPLAALIALLAQGHLSRRTVPHAERSEEHWGWLLGLVLSLLALQYSLQDLQFSAPPAHVLAFGLPACLALTVFAWRQWHKERPLINYRALLQGRYLLGLAFYFVGYFLTGASGFLLPIFAQQALGISMLATAALLSLSFFASMSVALLHAILARRWPWHRLYMLVGLALSLLGCLGLGLIGPDAGWSGLLLPALVSGCAAPFFLGPIAFGTFVGIEERAFSHAYQVKNIVRQLGLSTAVAVSTLLLQWSYAYHLPSAAAPLPSAPTIPAAAAVSQPEWVLHLLGGVRTAAGSSPAQALFMACSDSFLLLALVVPPLAALAWRQKTFR